MKRGDEQKSQFCIRTRGFEPCVEAAVGPEGVKAGVKSWLKFQLSACVLAAALHWELGNYEVEVTVKSYEALDCPFLDTYIKLVLSSVNCRTGRSAKHLGGPVSQCLTLALEQLLEHPSEVMSLR
jgi:hypothetical protein